MRAILRTRAEGECAKWHGMQAIQSPYLVAGADAVAEPRMPPQTGPVAARPTSAKVVGADAVDRRRSQPEDRPRPLFRKVQRLM